MIIPFLWMINRYAIYSMYDLKGFLPNTFSVSSALAC